MNAIINDILKNRACYCHVIEIENVYEYISIIESLIEQDKEKYSLSDFIEFFSSIEIYYIGNEVLEGDFWDDLNNIDIEKIVKEFY